MLPLLAIVMGSVEDSLLQKQLSEATVISRSDRLGLSESKILAMGIERWHDHVHGEFQSKWPDSLAFAPGGPTIVYAVLLKRRNDRLIRNASPRARVQAQKFRKSGEWLASYCISLEDNESGGGTYSIHMSRDAAVDLEQALYEILTTPPKVTFGAHESQVEARIRSALRFRTVPRDWGTSLLGRPIDGTAQKKDAVDALRNHKPTPP